MRKLLVQLPFILPKSSSFISLKLTYSEPKNSAGTLTSGNLWIAQTLVIPQGQNLLHHRGKCTFNVCHFLPQRMRKLLGKSKTSSSWVAKRSIPSARYFPAPSSIVLTWYLSMFMLSPRLTAHLENIVLNLNSIPLSSPIVFIFTFLVIRAAQTQVILIDYGATILNEILYRQSTVRMLHIIAQPPGSIAYIYH